MRRTLAKWLLVVGVGAMALLAQGCKRHAAPAPTPVAAPRVAPEPRFEPFPSDAGAVRDTGPAAAVRHRRRENLPVVTPAPVVQETEAEAEARQREQDAGLLRQQEAASQKQQQELNQTVQQSQKAQEEEQADPRIQDAPEPSPGARIQDAPGPSQPPPPPASPQV